MSCVSLAIQRRFIHGLGSCPHFDAIHRAGRQTQLTPGAAVDEHGVHILLGADNRIDRTGRQTAGAADAARFIDPRDALRRLDAVERLDRKSVV